jgi:phosphoribosyl 1,2-cyclic phosphodiesterase
MSGKDTILAIHKIFSISMSLFIASLNSGSNGNCYYIGNENEAVLIDAGISCRETERRMKRLELSIQRVKAIFISHEHGDHIGGVSVLSKKYGIRVFITRETLENSRLRLKRHLINNFSTYVPVRVGDLTITALPTNHDACDPHNFVVSDDKVNVGVFTDLGRACEHVTRQFRQCHAAFLESNYDEVMLETGSYSTNLKKRIRSGHGHLSNTQALQLFLRHRPAFMSHLFLSHLSAENNRPEIVRDLFSRNAGKTEILVASRYQESPVIPVVNRDHLTRRVVPPVKALQLALFG